MSQDQARPPRSQSDQQLEREIRKERKFSLSEAIGRLAGPGAMKGASPVTRTRQAEAAIGEYLRLHVSCAGGGGGGAGCLVVVLSRQVLASEKLLNNLDQPLIVLADYLQRVLASQPLLADLVRETDVEWGRLYDERPHFEREGAPADRDDPYTLESVRCVLSELLQTLGKDLLPTCSRPS